VGFWGVVVCVLWGGVVGGGSPVEPEKGKKRPNFHPIQIITGCGGLSKISGGGLLVWLLKGITIGWRPI